MDRENRRVALITGATGGLGTAMCKRLITDGYRVAGTYRDKSKLSAWQLEMEKEGYFLDVFEVDVADFDSVGNTIANVEEKIGPIDVLINNAGIARDGVLRRMTKEAWDDVINTNLTSVFNTCRHVINGMIERGFGRIINISSVNAQRGQVGQTNYSAAKAGMHGFTKSLAMEVATKGITVNTISPGYIYTEIVKAIPDEIIRTKILPGIPMGRLGGTDEVAYLVSFLASDEARFITGANYAINGGQHVY
ncbi:acetoacetyl-CoA reductase [Catalinimonas alkaloidigena]|uniref:Acetoacetyl-CoA reductase n=1 Tax=Catalinimonas alkaloidigena TaxID=1075417 RepID=A0A1G8XYT9_9BACT|nr:acetoacetyl-CoA reductase [Catalinimonas alkaloidigena]SDJ95693.1 acetoacetyl-CoA reductase [Catalinimonas alkaloidigena]